jgi:pyroglutamyl-peptidase
MQNTILLTSFTTWKPHHTTNASDDLLAHICGDVAESMSFLRGLPVDFELAPRRVLARFDELKPDILVCCGMAEERDKLNIESRAVVDDVTTMTELDLEQLTRSLPMTAISHDAGGFVCNTLYFEMLNHLKAQQRQHHCVFAHVPVLGTHNVDAIKRDFLTLLQRLGAAQLAA